jgi:hypothetical protein
MTCCPKLLSGTDRAKTLGHALVQADNSLSQLIDGGDQGETYGGYDESVFDQVLAGFILPELFCKRLSLGNERLKIHERLL